MSVSRLLTEDVFVPAESVKRSGSIERSLRSWAVHGPIVPGVGEGSRCPGTREQCLPFLL